MFGGVVAARRATNAFASTSRSLYVKGATEKAALTGADKLMHDALLLEAEEEAVLARRTQIQDPNDPVWTGEERVQDTVLRMVMDKYKPLRIKSTDASHPADAKIKAGIQTPTPVVATETVTASLHGSQGTGEYENGRRLPKTPDERPWRAVYVRPAHLSGAGAGEDVPSVYYGQFLQPSTRGSEMRSKLNKAGVTNLPYDNPKAMKQLRQGLKTAERRGKLLKARDSVLDYAMAKSDNPDYAMAKSDNPEGLEPSSDPNLQLQLGQARGWANVVEERIKAAQEAGLFKENKLRGKPITRDIEERNPFLGREEFFMNRIVKRQGAAPPWVELNMALESELASWKERMTDAWVRRASRMIASSPSLRIGMEPLSNKDSNPGEVPASQTPGEQKLIEVATLYRDMEWQDRERAYHNFELKRLNDLIRNHNHLAPFTARKGLLMLNMELEAMYHRSLPLLISRLSEMLEQERNPSKGLRDSFDTAMYAGQPITYDVWGREVKHTVDSHRGSSASWFGRGAEDDQEQAVKDTDVVEGARHRRPRPKGPGLLVTLRRSVEWARERIGV